MSKKCIDCLFCNSCKAIEIETNRKYLQAWCLKKSRADENGFIHMIKKPYSFSNCKEFEKGHE